MYSLTCYPNLLSLSYVDYLLLDVQILARVFSLSSVLFSLAFDELDRKLSWLTSGKLSKGSEIGSSTDSYNEHFSAWVFRAVQKQT